MKIKYRGLPVLLLAAIALLCQSATAAVPTCYNTHGGYCQYTGHVKKVYVNSSGMILLYFDTYFPPGNADVANYQVTNGNAAIVLISDFAEFSKLFYSTALAAQASKRNVTIQMRGVYGGYLKADRIWLAE